MKISNYFEKRYLDSLNSYRFFYDDVHEYGNPASADHVFYFIPGLDGAAGQIRFPLPAFYRRFGHRVYIRCLYMPEFSASRPIWEKYTHENLNKRRVVIRNDLEALAAVHGRVHVLASSSGFYEFAAAYSTFPPGLREALTLLWAAAAPDHFEPTPWESVFYPLSGIEREGFRWTALPNHNAFGMLNSEARYTFRWRQDGETQTLYKGNLESRFRAVGLSWGYFSLANTNWIMNEYTSHITEPLDIDATVLAGTQDGYWQGKSKDDMMGVINRYLCRPRFLWKEASHLWVVAPENIDEFLQVHDLSASEGSLEQESSLCYS